MTASIQDSYTENGYYIAERLINDAMIDRLIDEAALICRGARGSVRGLPASTLEDPDEAVFRKILAIHFPHKISPLYTDFLAHPPLVDILRRIIGPNVKCMQSLLFIKPPGMPGQAWHQDEIPIPTRDRSLTGAWVALDDATVDNGCVWVIPGSHRPGILYERRPHDDPRYDRTPQATRFPYTEADAVPVEIERGSALFFNGYLLHRSLNNKTEDQWRRTLVMHYMNAASFLPWSEKDDYRDIVLVAGEDPYTYKGVENLREPFIREPE